MPAHGYPAVYSFASLPLYLLVNALVLESEVDTMLSLDLFWTYFRLLHLNRILNRVIRIAVIVTTGCHFYFIAREKVYFDATGFLAVIIRNRYYCTVFLILRFNFFPPRQVLRDPLIISPKRNHV